MALGKRLINTGAAAACLTETTDIFGDSSGVALYSLDFDASTAPDGTDYSGSPSNVDFGVGGQINYGARFNGSSSVINISSTATTPFDASSEDYAISMWVNVSTFANDKVFIAKWGATDSIRSYWLGLQGSSGDNTKIAIYERSGSTTSTFNGTTSLAANTWYHIVYVRNATQVLLYIDGVEQTFSATNSINQGGTNNVTIGQYSGLGSSTINGTIDQVRIFSKALSSSEVSTLYAETACVYTSTTDTVNYPTGTTPVAYYKLDNSAEDEKGSYDGTESNIEYRFGRFGQAADFNGSSSKITLPTGSPFNDSNTIKAVSVWVKADTLTSRVFPLSISSTTNTNDYWYIGYMGDIPAIYIATRDGSSSNQSIASASITRDTNWHHLVVQITATEKEIYLDGVKQTITNSNSGSGTNTSWISYPSYSGTVQGAIGVLRLSSPQYSNGFVDQVRIYDAALTSDQVTELYNEKPEVDTSNFKTVLYEGTGSTQYISNVGMDLETYGGLVWVKNRDTTKDHKLADSVRGAAKIIESSTTDAEITATGSINAFNANGFEVGSDSSVNGNGNDLVAWVWKGGGDAVAGTGTNVSNFQRSTNVEAGFSILNFTSNGSKITAEHGLNYTPELLITKSLNNIRDWYTWYKDFNESQILQLNDNRAVRTVTGFWDTVPDSTNVYYSDAQTNNLDEYVFYCFHSVSGYSKIGSYEGLGTSTVTVSGLGFKPSWIIVKNADDTANWNIYDSRRSGNDSGWGSMDTMNDILYPNLNIAEVEGGSTHVFTANSDGFVVGASNHLQNNKAGDTFIYMAFK